jgi:serine/threonine protein kinase
MAQLRQDKIGFKAIQLFKHQILGIGSYGKVCKAECDGLVCAAKLMHETLFDPTVIVEPGLQREHRLPMRRFEQECDFLSAVRHPNIIQYLGVHQDPDTHFPVILMELMDDSLTHYLETSTKPIPYSIQINLSHDVALALVFLHSNGIVHRDLSSNNVLLIGNMRAKVTDFGMARLRDLNPNATHLTFTMCPGTDVYMPPEAVKDKPLYTEKIDCFSFGVLAIQIMTQLFPHPGDRRKEIEIEQVGLVEKRICEYERRQSHISQIESSHPLLAIALKCLKDKDVDRPSAREICTKVALLKQKFKDPECINVSVASEKKKSVQGDSEERKESLSLHQYVEQIEDLQSQIVYLEATLKAKDKTIAAKLLEIEQLKKPQYKEIQLEERENDRKPKRELDGNLCKEFEVTSKEKTPQSDNESQIIKLQWAEGIQAPLEMSRQFSGMVDAIVNDEVIYMMEGTRVYAYSANSSTWSQLPSCTFTSCPAAIINDLLTLIGGACDDNIINKLFSLTKKGDMMKWTEEFPPMPTKRWGASALCIETALIVAGGQGEKAEVDLLTTVEVMNKQTHHWSRTAVDLPQPAVFASLLRLGNHVYMLGGYDKNIDPITLPYRCPLSALLRPSSTKSLSLEICSTTDVWSSASDVPVKHSTYVIFCGQLLALGGVDSYSKSITAVFLYDPSTDIWEVVSHMRLPRQQCFAAVLPGNQLLVVGGKIDTEQITNAVEIGTCP